MRILSIDGGGIKGVLPAVWLAELEKKLGSPLNKNFDLVIGTSTGAGIACGVGLGMPANTYLDMYMKYGKDIFPGFWKRLPSRMKRFFTQGISHPKFDGKGLDRSLVKIFGDQRMHHMEIPVLITAYNTQRRSAKVFKSTKRADSFLSAVDVCRASMAAPTYLPGHVIRKQPYIDGGAFANHPVMCGIAEACRMGTKKEDIIAVAIGTGDSDDPITARHTKEWGGLEWVLPIIDVLMDGSEDSNDYIARQVLEQGNYIRIQTKVNSKMDNTKDKNLESLQDAAYRWLERGGNEVLDGIVEKVQK
jgi:patatin-like phospholipase/acyl hydrolase